jgi:hypothetical protein
VDPTQTLRVCVQNTQRSFQLYGNGIEMSTMLTNISKLGAQMFVPISPNINWVNPTNGIRTKQLFCQFHPQLHLSSVSSDIGLDKEYINKSMVGGAAIITSRNSSTKVSEKSKENSRYGIFTSTTIQGKQNKKITFIVAYIAVTKGSDIGVESLYTQQMTIYERQILHSKQ